MDLQATHHIVQRELSQHGCVRVPLVRGARGPLLGAYRRKAVEHLDASPKDEWDEEEDALRSALFGENA